MCKLCKILQAHRMANYEFAHPFVLSAFTYLPSGYFQ